MKTREQVRRQIEDVGIVPVVRASSADAARFAAEAVMEGGIPIVEVTMTVPDAIKVIAELRHSVPDVLVGAGTVLDAESARRCLDAGAQFLVSPGFNLETVQLARKEGVLMVAGALTPTEIITAWNAGSDFVKVFPCGQVGGPAYIKALKGPLPQIPLMVTGGVNLETAAQFIHAGVAALGVGGELILKEALQSRQKGVIEKIARQYVDLIARARAADKK